VDADTDQPIVDLQDGMLVSAPDHPNIVAEVRAHVGHSISVVFYLNGRKRTENRHPFSFFHDLWGDYRVGKLEPGDYELVATPYSQNNAQGIIGQSLKINFTVASYDSNLVIKSFSLVDPDMGQHIQELSDGDVISVDGRPNIRANTGDNTQSVVFYLNGVRRVENEAPYSYFYDVEGVYRPGRLHEGTYRLEATAYSGNNATGKNGNTEKIEFTVTGNPSGASVAFINFYPSPAANASQVEISGSPESHVHIQVTDQYGYKRSLIHQGQLDINGYLKKSVDVTTLPPGNYIMLIRVDDQITTKRFNVK